MTFGVLARKAGVAVASSAALGAALLLATPPALPALVLDPSTRSASTDAAFLELHRDHYGKAASQAEQQCGDEFGYDKTAGAPLRDGWHFVTRSDTDVVTLQVVFRDSSVTPAATRTYRIVSNGSSVTSTPGPGGSIAFSKDYAHVVVITPNPGAYRLLSATDAALTAPSGAEYPKTIYSRTAGGTDTSTVGYFNLSHGCASRPLTPPHSDCQYGGDSSTFTVPTSFTGSTLSGSLTCNGVPQPGQTVTAKSASGTVTAVTSDTGAFTLTGLPVGSIELSFPGTATVPAATPVTVTRTA